MNQPQAKSALKILIVEDHMLTNECLKIGLQKYPEYNIVGQAHDGNTAVKMAQQFQPEIVLMDVCMPEMDGIQATAKIKAAYPATKVIMVTSLMEKRAVKTAFAAKADAFCTKETDLNTLRKVIDVVCNGAVWLDPKIARFVIDEMLSIPEGHVSEKTTVAITQPPKTVLKIIEPSPTLAEPKLSVPPLLDDSQMMPLMATSTQSVQELLTPRELQILKMIADNLSNESIAEKLSISSAWISGYITNILNKLTVGNEVQAVKRALSDGLIQQSTLLDG